jgi:hypothetical protein
MHKYNLKQRVEKKGTASNFVGEIVAVFLKRDGKTQRYVVENDYGILHIANEKQLTPIEDRGD